MMLNGLSILVERLLGMVIDGSYVFMLVESPGLWPALEVGIASEALESALIFRVREALTGYNWYS